MKKMKKVLALILCVMAVMIATVGCGSAKYADSKYTGQWKATTGEYLGIEIAIADIFEGDVIMELQADGKAVLTADGDTEKGTWEETEDGVVLDGYDGIKITSAEEGKLSIDYEGVTINFEKQ